MRPPSDIPPIRSKKECLRWSIPSIVLATISILLSICSYFLVQPNIQQRYRDICHRNLRILRLSDSESFESALKKDFIQERNSVEANSVERDRNVNTRLYEETLLCLKRLIVWDNSDDSLRFMAALVSERFADHLLELSRARSIHQERDKPFDELIPRSYLELRNALNSMRSVVAANGPLANKAMHWIVRHRLSEDMQTEAVELEALERDVRHLVDVDETSSVAQQTLGEILVRKALRGASILVPSQRLAFLREAALLFQGIPDTDLRSMVWAAEANLAMDPGAAKEIAWKAAQRFWAEGDSPLSSPETLAAVFDCLLITGSFKEAQGFLVKRLDALATFDQDVFKQRSADACLRSVIANALLQWNDSKIQTNPVAASVSDSLERPPNASEVQAIRAGSRDVALLSLAIQLQPESPDLLALIEEVATKHQPGDWLDDLYSDSQKSNDVPLRQLILAVEALLANDDSFDFDLLSEAVKGDLVYGVVASKLALMFAQRESVNHKPLVRMLASINDAAPDLLVVWWDRAKLHIMKQQYDSALDCMKFLNEKLPDNQSVAESMQEIESNRQRDLK